VAGFVTVVFIYNSYLKMAAPLSNSTIIEQRAVGQNALKHRKPVISKKYRGLLSESGSAPR
jgi:hypothetical protein